MSLPLATVLSLKYTGQQFGLSLPAFTSSVYLIVVPRVSLPRHFRTLSLGDGLCGEG